MKRQTVLVLMLVGLIGLLVAACGADDPTATPVPPEADTPSEGRSAFEIEWDALVAAAREEGELQAFLCCTMADAIEPLTVALEEKFGIKLVASSGSSRNQAEKVKAERDAGKYTLDIWTGGPNTSNNRLRPFGVLDPVKPLLFHPEILDDSVWQTGQLEWTDLDTRNTVLAFRANATTAEISYNTNLIDPNDIQSWRDLLKPEYHGLIVAANDPRAAGAGTQTVFLFANPDLGPEYMTALFTETDITIQADPVQATNLLAKGTYALCILGCGTEARKARDDAGLPVEDAWPFVLAEGSRASVGGSGLMAINRGPNPNARKLFINWFMSREGQILYQKATGDNSLRIDIPKDTVDKANLWLEGRQYAIQDTQPDYQDQLAAAMARAEEALASVGK